MLGGMQQLIRCECPFACHVSLKRFGCYRPRPLRPLRTQAGHCVLQLSFSTANVPGGRQPRGKLAIMTHVNCIEFEDAAFEVNLGRAIGLQADGTFSGGMVSVTVSEVPVGANLCRITHSALPAEVSLTSPWWAYKADFALILSRALATSADFRDILHDSLALASDYTIPDDRADMIRARYGR